MNPQRPDSFLDARTLLAIALVIGLWMGWQSYMEKKYPSLRQNQGPQAEKTVDSVDSKENGDQKGDVGKGLVEDPAKLVESDKPANPEVVEEKFFTFENQQWKIEFSSKGMAVRRITLKKYKDREGHDFIELNKGKRSFFETRLVSGESSETLDFAVEEVGDGIFRGVAETRGIQVEKVLEVQSGLYTIENKIQVQGNLEAATGLQTSVHWSLKDEKESNFLMPGFDTEDFYLVYENTTDRVTIDREEATRESFSKVQLMSVADRYFMSAIVDSSDVLPRATVAVKPATQSAEGILHYPFVSQRGKLNLQFKGFVGPKEYSLLSRVDDELPGVIDFGWVSGIGIGLLKIMNWFHGLIPNYGVAIILLTLFVRLLVLPFNIISFKSMRKMQEIQPRLKSLREKYKDDPQTLNRETMMMMRQLKVNPLGGCLPMLIQFPIFISLYRVFGQSIELYQEPFFGWIQDLSLKDPYYVLPVLMGITMYVQTKLTPTTMDKQQAKIMAMIPLVFTVLMVSLPSSLTLYIFVSTLFGVIQQYVFLRDRSAQTQLAGNS